jgi:hypothetical protein
MGPAASTTSWPSGLGLAEILGGYPPPPIPARDKARPAILGPQLPDWSPTVNLDRWVYLPGDTAGIPLGDSLLGLLRRRRPGHGAAGDAIAHYPSALVESDGVRQLTILEQAFDPVLKWLAARPLCPPFPRKTGAGPSSSRRHHSWILVRQPGDSVTS